MQLVSQGVLGIVNAPLAMPCVVCPQIVFIDTSFVIDTIMNFCTLHLLSGGFHAGWPERVATGRPRSRLASRQRTMPSEPIIITDTIASRQ